LLLPNCPVHPFAHVFTPDFKWGCCCSIYSLIYSALCLIICSFFLLLLAIVLSVLPRYTASYYSFVILWPLCCLSFLGLRLLITPLSSSSFSYWRICYNGLKTNTLFSIIRLYLLFNRNIESNTGESTR